jgi:hypothetical protein
MAREEKRFTGISRTIGDMVASCTSLRTGSLTLKSSGGEEFRFMKK